jgi:predicted phosphate transport protein (TIGR00153 family)
LASIFGSSPVEPIQAHMDMCHAAVTELVRLLDAAASGDWDAAEKSMKAISAKEVAADDLKHETRRLLSGNLMMPVPRTDLLDLIQTQDEVANLAKRTARMIVWRQLKIPEPVRKRFLDLLDESARATKKARKSIRELDELYETVFKGAEAEKVEAIISELEDIETETDRMQGALRIELREIENDYPPMEMMFLYKLVDLVGEIADTAEHVGRRLNGLLRC